MGSASFYRENCELDIQIYIPLFGFAFIRKEESNSLFIKTKRAIHPFKKSERAICSFKKSKRLIRSFKKSVRANRSFKKSKRVICSFKKSKERFALFVKKWAIRTKKQRANSQLWRECLSAHLVLVRSITNGNNIYLEPAPLLNLALGTSNPRTRSRF